METVDFEKWYGNNKRRVTQIHNIVRAQYSINEDDFQDIIAQTRVNLFIYCQQKEIITSIAALYQRCLSNLAITHKRAPKNKELSLDSMNAQWKETGEQGRLDDRYYASDHVSDKFLYSTEQKTLDNFFIDRLLTAPLQQKDRETLDAILNNQPIPGARTNRWRRKHNLVIALQSLGILPKPLKGKFLTYA